MMAAAACAFAGAEGGVHVRRAVEMLCTIQTNAFHRFDADLADQVGIFLDPTLAMANHSCVPNATVLFAGRTAVLRAERPIREGEEIEICYTDYTNPVAARQSALQEYNFVCRCPRCADNLNVYQVRAQFSSGGGSTTIVPDTWCSVVGSDTARLQHHPGASDPHKMQIAARFCAQPDPELTGSSPEARALLGKHLGRCAALVDNDLWAVAPLPQMLTEISLCYAQEQRYAYAVVVAAMVAVECDPYRYAAPFHVVRLKNLLMVVKLLAWTAEDAAALRGRGRGRGREREREREQGREPSRRGSLAASRTGAAGHLESEITETLAGMDQVSLSQMLLMMVLKATSPAEGALDQSSLGLQARELHDDIAALGGREKELSLIHAWRDDPESEASRMFFEYAVVSQMAALASLGKRVVRLEWHV
ncbi:hypothetical protein E4U53_003101 [Claviceps sorghi]|nr:hypothetical protein E4U53_003101 [Claviceps sorghi]